MCALQKYRVSGLCLSNTMLVFWHGCKFKLVIGYTSKCGLLEIYALLCNKKNKTKNFSLSIYQWPVRSKYAITCIASARFSWRSLSPALAFQCSETLCTQSALPFAPWCPILSSSKTRNPGSYRRCRLMSLIDSVCLHTSSVFTRTPGVASRLQVAHKLAGSGHRHSWPQPGHCVRHANNEC